MTAPGAPAGPAAVRRAAGAIGAAGVVIVLTVLPSLVDGYTLLQAARLAALAPLAASTALLTGTAGLPTLGQVAPYAVGAYTAAHLAESGAPALAQLVAGALAGGVFALVCGPAVVRTRGVVCLMVTLAIGELTAVAAEQWRSVTGGTDGFPRVPAFPMLWGGENLVHPQAVYSYVVAVVVAILLVTVLAVRSPYGALVRGVGDNETRMRASGHPVGRYLLWTYTAAGVLAGAGGGLLITVNRTVSPSDAGFGTAALMLLAVVIGGAGSIVGAAAAAAGIVAVRDWIAVDLPGRGPLLLGLLFIVAVYTLPRGLSGLLGRLLPGKGRPS